MEQDYVFIQRAKEKHDEKNEEEEEEEDIVEIDALSDSTEIVKHTGYTEAINSAQAFLDSRLLAYSTYQMMAPDDEVLLTPLGDHPLRISSYCLHSTSTTRTRPTRRIYEKSRLKRNPASHAKKIRCRGYKECPSIDKQSREALKKLELEGVAYMPHDTAYSVKYLSPVLPFGDCLFLSIEQLLLHTDECESLPPHKIRQQAAKYFFKHYQSVSDLEREKIDQTIKNLYFPSLQGGWGVSPIQTRRYVALRSEKDLLVAKIFQLQDRGYSWERAAEIVYSEYTQPVVNAETYCKYMTVGNGGKNTHFLVSLSYSQNGLVSIDNDPENRRVAWGDDIVLESLATAYQRDIFVVLVGCGQIFFLPHRPRAIADEQDSENESASALSKGYAPWFLLMRATGVDRGGDHYEPMYCERLRGDGHEDFGVIGD